MLRFYTDLEYELFSSNPLLKRAEMYKCWSDLEDLTNSFDTLESDFKHHEETSIAAFKNISTQMNSMNQNLTQRISKNETDLSEIVSKVNNMSAILERVADKTQNELRTEIMTEARNIVKVRMDEMIDLVEKYSTLVKTQEKRQNEFESKIELKYGLENERKNKIEEILQDHIDLIRKLHTQQINSSGALEAMSKSFNNKLTELRNDTSAVEKFYGVEKSIRALEDQISDFRNDQKAYKSLVEEDMNSWKLMSQNLIEETNAQFRVFEKNLNKLSMPELQKLEEKIQNAELEIVNVKNMYLKSISSSKIPPPDITSSSELKKKDGIVKADTSHIKSLGEELDEISLFVQKFADSHVTDKIRIIKDTETTIKDKMDTLDWLARNAEFLSTDSVINMLKEFKELYTKDSPTVRNQYVTSRNQSVAIINVLQQIESTVKLEPSDDTDYKISLLYSILEPLLINNYNLEKAVDMEIVDVIMSSLRQSLKYLDASTDPGVKSLIYQK